MKECPTCSCAHDKPGSYCSRACANKQRTHSKLSRQKRAIAAKESWASRSEDDRSKLREKLRSISFVRAQSAVPRWKDAAIPWCQLGADSRRMRVIHEQSGRCVCGISEWRGVSITLEVDHIDGDHANNARENLIALCPNCHSITPTFRGKNKPAKRVSDDELARAIKSEASIRLALISVGLSPRGGNYKRAKRIRELLAHDGAPCLGA